MKRNLLIILLIFLFIAPIHSCSGDDMPQSEKRFKHLKEIPDSSWNILNKKKVFFGHQSVGNNIIQGIKEVEEENPQIKVDIIEANKSEKFENGAIYHFNVGENEYPFSKIKDFDNKIRTGLGKTSDVALFKFCFVDVTADTNVEKLFQEYQNTMSSLKKEYPQVVFVHITIPVLRNEKFTFRTYIKKLMGKADGFFDSRHNIKRNEYNNLIRNHFGKEPIFDLAEIESTHQDGTREIFSSGGKIYYALAPEYTNDGGHLNNLGRRVVAEQFLIMLSLLNK